MKEKEWVLLCGWCEKRLATGDTEEEVIKKGEELKGSECPECRCKINPQT